VEEAPADDHVDVDESPVRRRGLFGRRRHTTDEPVAADLVDDEVVEPVAVEPVAFEPVDVEPVDAVVEEPVADLVAEPGRRRALFGRRQRETQPAEVDVDPDVNASNEVPPTTEAAPPVGHELFAHVADAVSPDSFATQLPQLHQPEPAPMPAAPVYFAPAIDILPGRPMGRRGKHGKPAPEVAVAPAAPVAPYVAPPVAAPVSAPPSFAAPVTPEPVRAPAPVLREDAPPSAPPRQASPQAPVSQPAASSPISELDQLSLNAELQKSALSELRGLYEPAFSQSAPSATDAAAGLIRRQRRAVEAVAEVVPAEPSRARDATQVRGMLSGFRAGVERGRTAPSEAPDDDAAPPTDDSTD
jgi:hypothetical protein